MTHPEQQPQHVESETQATPRLVEQLGNIALTSSQDGTPALDKDEPGFVSRPRYTEQWALQGQHPHWLGFDSSGNPR